VNQGQVLFRTYTTLARCLAAMPEPMAMALGNRVGDVLFAVRADQRRMVSANLARVLDADPSDQALLDRWARRSFRAYARYWVEGARLGRRTLGAGSMGVHFWPHRTYR
jgi:lauroyl/myristoyl acyltransferase